MISEATALREKMVHKEVTAINPVVGYADTVLSTYVISVTSATFAELLTYPLDLTKTRLQIQGELEKKDKTTLKSNHRGMIRTAVGIVEEEGLLKLWQGVTPAIYRHVVYSGFRIVTYEWLRDDVFKKGIDGTFPLWKSALSGILSGAIAQFFASPADLIKVQVQMEGKRLLMGKTPRVDGPVDAFQKILRTGGVKGLWKGSIPNVQRAALVNLGDLTTYDMAKQFVMNKFKLSDNHLTHVLSSICAGLVAASMGTPADVVKTRIMNQPTDEYGRGVYYKSSVDCLIRTIKNEGFFALYKGFFPVWIRMAPWSLTFWLSFEQIRHTMRTGSI